MGSKLAKETIAIQKALGEKMGTIILALAMCVSGMVFGFTRGWSYCLPLLAIFPVVVGSTVLMTKVMQKGFMANMVAYSQSAGYAEQALNAIQVVSAFGQEMKEV